MDSDVNGFVLEAFRNCGQLIATRNGNYLAGACLHHVYSHTVSILRGCLARLVFEPGFCGISAHLAEVIELDCGAAIFAWSVPLWRAKPGDKRGARPEIT